MSEAAAPGPRPLVATLRHYLHLVSPWGPPLAKGELSRPQRRLAAVAGTLAATTALLVVLILRFQGLAIFLPESAVEFVVDHIPGSLEAGAIGLMGGYAKVLGVALAIGGFLAVHAFLALYFPRAERILPEKWKRVAAFAAVPSLATLLVVLPVFGEGVAGADSQVGPAVAVASVALGSLTFAGVLEFAYAEFKRTNPEGIDLTRRTAIQAAALLLITAAVGTALVSNFIVRGGRLAFASVADLRLNEITPTASFYIIQKNLSSPTVNPSSWVLSVDGLVDHPLAFSSNDLLARPPTEEAVTLECVSNTIGGSLISTARWSGVPLSELFAEAGVHPGASWVLFTCEDEYTVAVPLMRASAPGALLALTMNGERLPRDHGFPARILVPGIYGMMNAKWVKRITLLDHEVQGYWQQKGWSNDARIRTQAIIAVAPPTSRQGAPVSIGGVAFAGDRAITRVEVSEDGGATWADATLFPPLSPYAWTLWSVDWTPTREGRFVVQARAWSREGGVDVLQESAHEGAYPKGASGYDSVEVTVSA